MVQDCQNAHDITTFMYIFLHRSHTTRISHLLHVRCLTQVPVDKRFTAQTYNNTDNCMHALDKNANLLVKKIRNTTIKAQHPSDPEQLFISFTKTNCQNVSSVLCNSPSDQIKKTLTIWTKYSILHWGMS